MKRMYQKDNLKKGYVALMSAIIISLILVGLSFSISTSGYFSRFNILNSQFKRISQGLSESCANTALLKIAQNYLYSPAVGGDVIILGTEQCTIKDITYGAEDPVTHQKIATIKTQAQYHGSFSNMNIHAAVKNPIAATVFPPPDFTFAVTPTSILGGNTAYLSWSVPNSPVTSYSIDHGIGSISSSGGSIAITPSVSTTYTATAVGSGGTIAHSASITVQPPPSCADTVMILDRSGSMSSSDLAGEKSAANALTSLYEGVIPHPGLGVGSFGGLNGAAAQIPTLGLIATSSYTNLKSAITQITSSNSSVGSDLSAAISAASTELTGPRHTAGLKKVLILVSDGVPNQPSSTTGSTPTLSPTSNSQNATGDTWINPSFAYSNGSGDATDTGGHRHRFSNFNAVIPSGSTITGIETDIDSWSTNTGTNSTITLYPLSIGNYDQWTASNGTSQSSRINAIQTNDGDTSYISETTNNQAETYGVSGSSIPVGAMITSVTLNTVSKSSGGSASIKLRVEKGTNSGNQNDDANQNLTTSYAQYNRTMNVNPFTAVAWTISDLSSTKFGIVRTNTSGGTPRVTNITISVTYTTVSSGCQVGVDLSWNAGASWSSEKTQTVTSSESTYVLGNSTDKWGTHTWVPSDFSNSNFRARIRNIDTGSTCSNTAVSHMDWLRLIISYSSPVSSTAVGLASADSAKMSAIDIFGIHFGDVSGRDYLAQLSSGGVANGTHQPASKNDAGTSTSLPLTTAENTDGDYFFISPTSSDMTNIFQTIATIVCPAAAAPPPSPSPPSPPAPPPPQPNIIIGSWNEASTTL